MAKNGHRKERRSVTHLLAMDKRRRKAKGPIKQITAADMQKDYEQLTAQFNELGKLWKIYKVYFDIVGMIDSSKKEDEVFIANNQICIDEDSKVDTTVNALKEKSFNTENDDDLATFESTIDVFDILQESVLVMNDTYTKLTSINTYCKELYPTYRDMLYVATDIYGKVFDKMFDYKTDEITVDVDMSKEEISTMRSLGNRPTELVSTPKELNYIVTSHSEHEDKVISNSTIPSIEDVAENNTLDMMYIDPEAFKNVDKTSELDNSYFGNTLPETMDNNYNIDTEKESNNGEEHEGTEREERKED